MAEAQLIVKIITNQRLCGGRGGREGCREKVEGEMFHREGKKDAKHADVGTYRRQPFDRLNGTSHKAIRPSDSVAG